MPRARVPRPGAPDDDALGADVTTLLARIARAPDVRAKLDAFILGVVGRLKDIVADSVDDTAALVYTFADDLRLAHPQLVRAIVKTMEEPTANP